MFQRQIRRSHDAVPIPGVQWFEAHKFFRGSCPCAYRREGSQEWSRCSAKYALGSESSSSVYWTKGSSALWLRCRNDFLCIFTSFTGWYLNFSSANRTIHRLAVSSQNSHPRMLGAGKRARCQAPAAQADEPKKRRPAAGTVDMYTVKRCASSIQTPLEGKAAFLEHELQLASRTVADHTTSVTPTLARAARQETAGAANPATIRRRQTFAESSHPLASGKYGNFSAMKA